MKRRIGFSEQRHSRVYTLKSSASALVRKLPSPMNLRKTGFWSSGNISGVEVMSICRAGDAVLRYRHQSGSVERPPGSVLVWQTRYKFLAEQVFVPRLR